MMDTHKRNGRGTAPPGELAQVLAQVLAEVRHLVQGLQWLMRVPELVPPMGPRLGVDGLTPLERAVFAVLTAEPQKVKVITRLCGRSPGRVREAVASLCNKELAQRTPKGIRLPREGGAR